jgi:ribosomal 50S subunit-recycling heat shock protein
MRIDRFLKLSRLVKRRAAAAEMVEVGAVRLGGRTVKPAHDVKPGDTVEIAFPRRLLAVEVTTVEERALRRGVSSYKIVRDNVLSEDEKPW